MFNFFKKKDNYTSLNEVQSDYSALMVDMHSHVLPGIDDGAQTPEESLVLIRKMIELGIKKIIATPHVMADHYRNTSETINNSLGILKAELNKEKIEITVEAAAEYYFDETFENLVNQKKLMTMGNNFTLFELPFISNPRNLIQIITKMREFEYKPILAHPERYLYLKLHDYKIIKNHGCLLQLNTLSLAGYYGKEVKKKAEELADNHLVDFISSDMHHQRHAAALQDALSAPYVKNIISDKSLKNSLLI
ncbi:MAG: CpsB/CapC family capsule biosynthesis tyrosine phosphatase [Ginsengibacter sp.]